MAKPEEPIFCRPLRDLFPFSLTTRAYARPIRNRRFAADL